MDRNSTVTQVVGTGGNEFLYAQQMVRASLVLLIFSLILRLRSRTKMPPGPRPMPFIGNLHLLSKNPAQPYKILTELSRTYGPVMRFKFGGQESVVISDYELVKEAFVTNADITSERPDIILKWEEEKGGKESRRSQELYWRDIHKSNENILHKVAICRSPFEHRFGADLELLVNALGAHSEEFDPSAILTRCVTSISWHLGAGKRLEYDDPQLEKLMRLVFQNLYDMRSSMLQSYLHVPEWLQRLFMRRVMIPVYHQMYELIKQIISEHAQDQSGSQITDVVGAMLAMHRKQPDNIMYLEQGILRAMHSFMLGGVDSMQSVLRWLFLYFIHYPDVQERCYQDVMEHIGDSRIPSANDYPNLKYITATVYETLRHGNIAPLGVPHWSHVDVTVAGYVIPKETIIFSNQYAIHRDPTLWERPNDFLPERWLAEDGSLLRRNGFLPFSIGPRHCPGEKLAKLQLVLLTAGILQRYRIMPSLNAPVPDLEGVQVLSAAPKPFHIKITSR